MTSTGLLTIVLGFFGVSAALGQATAPGQRQGPGVQAPQDSRYQTLIATCKNPPPARGGAPGQGGQGGQAGQAGGAAQGAQAGGAAPAQGAAPTANQGPREYKVTEIPGVIA